MRKLLTLLILLSASLSLQAASVRYDNIALTTKNTAYGTAVVPVAGAYVAVCSQPATTASTPCTPKISLYSNSSLTAPIQNPTATDAKGNFNFYYDPSVGPVTIQIYGSGVQTYILADQNGSLSTQNSYTWGGTQTFNAIVTSTLTATDATITNATITNLTVGGSSITYPLPINLGGTGATSLAAALLPVFTGTPSTGNCVSWASATSIQDSGAPCGTGSGSVSSVAMSMDGVVFNSSVTGSPVTTTGTLAPSLANAKAGYVPLGPSTRMLALGNMSFARQQAQGRLTALPLTVLLWLETSFL